MKKTLLSIFLAFTAATALPAQEQKFTVSGNIEGLEAGDTLRFEQIIMPDWKTGDCFDIVLKKDGKFRYKGTQAHDQYYSMRYLPVSGDIPVCDRTGKSIIISDKNHIRLSGTREDIFYCSIDGGIYDEPQLAEYLSVEDSLGRERGYCRRKAKEAYAAGDKETASEYEARFNSFFRDNPGRDRSKALQKKYFDSHPEGTLYTLVEHVLRMDYTPVEDLKSIGEKLSPEAKDSYYGKLFINRIKEIEAIAPGNPAPDFTLTFTDGTSATKDDFKGQYLLIYHWGTCPGSMQIDPEVQDFYREYKDSGLSVVGLTASLEHFRSFADGVEPGSSAPELGIDDLKARVTGMLEHPWKEAETGHPENQKTADTFMISGLPYFLFIGPDGTILAKDFQPAFYHAKETLQKTVGK